MQKQLFVSTISENKLGKVKAFVTTERCVVRLSSDDDYHNLSELLEVVTPCESGESTQIKWTASAIYKMAKRVEFFPINSNSPNPLTPFSRTCNFYHIVLPLMCELIKAGDGAQVLIQPVTYFVHDQLVEALLFIIPQNQCLTGGGEIADTFQGGPIYRISDVILEFLLRFILVQSKIESQPQEDSLQVSLRTSDPGMYFHFLLELLDFDLFDDQELDEVIQNLMYTTSFDSLFKNNRPVFSSYSKIFDYSIYDHMIDNSSFFLQDLIDDVFKSGSRSTVHVDHPLLDDNELRVRLQFAGRMYPLPQTFHGAIMAEMFADTSFSRMFSKDDESKAPKKTWLETNLGFPIDSVKLLVEKLHSFIDDMNAGATKVKESFFHYLPKVTVIIYCVTLIYAAYKVIVKQDYSLLTGLGIFTAAVGFCLPEEIQLVADSVIQMEEVNTESPFGWDNIVSLLTLSLAFFANMDLKKFKFSVKDILNSVGSLPRLEKGVSHLFDSITRIMKAAINWIRETIFRMHPILENSSGVAEVDKYLGMCKPLIERSWNVLPPYKLEDYNEIMRLQTIGGQLLCSKSFGSTEIDTRVRRIISSMLVLLEKIRRPYDASPLRANFTKCEPLVILFQGEPGQGKSFVALQVAKALTELLCPGARDRVQEHEAEYIFQRAPETVYWDGYTGQFCTMVDDLGQSVDVKGQADSEYMSFFRMVNVFQAPLHMAELTQKASTFFQSRLVIATSNHTNFQTISSINFKDAFRRRFDVPVGIRVNVKQDENGNYLYSKIAPNGKHMLDISKFCKDSICFDIYNKVSEPGEETVVVNTFNFTEFIDHCKKIYALKSVTFEKSIEKAKNTIRELFTDVDQEEFFGISDLSVDPLDLLAKEVASIPELESSDDPEDYESPGVFGDFHAAAIAAEHDIRDFPKQKKEMERFLRFALTPGQPLFVKVTDMLQKQYYRIGIHLYEIYFEAKRKCNKLWKSFTDWAEDSLISVVQYLESCNTWIATAVSVTSVTIAHLFTKYPILKWSATILALVGLYKLFTWMFSSNDKDVESGGHGEYKRTTRSTPNVKVMNFRKDENGKYRAYDKSTESPEDVPFNDVQKKVLNKSTLIVRRAGIEEIWARATIIQGCVAIMPSHYFNEMTFKTASGLWSDQDMIQFYSSKDVLIKNTTVEELLNTERHEIPNNDLMLFSLPGKLRTFPNIVKHFIKEADLPIKYIDASLLTLLDDGNLLIQETDVKLSKETMYYGDTSNNRYSVNRSFSYMCESMPGDCGSIITASNLAYFPAPILGFHIAGQLTNQGKCGYSNVITYELLCEGLSMFSNIDKNSPPLLDHKYFKPSDIDHIYDTFRLAGKTTLPVGRAYKSKLVRTPHLYEALGPCNIAPANITPSIDYDPISIATSKYQQHAPHVPKEVLNFCVDDLSKEIISKSKPYVHYHLTFEQAVAGIPGNPYIKGLPRGTSAGYPYCKLKPPGSKGKRSIFGSEGDYDFECDESKKLKEEVLEILSKAREGIRMCHIYSDFLKDETRPLHKTRKPRLVSCAPVAFTIAFRMIFLPVQAWLMENRINNGFAVGINPFQEWTELAIHLQFEDTDNSMIAGDFSGFDTRISSMYQEPVFRFFSSVLSNQIDDDPTLKATMQVLLTDIFSSVHVVGDKLYYWTSGQPSGNPCTTIINCIVNRLLIRMAWVVCHDYRLSSLKDFVNYVRDVVYGDDNLISVHIHAQKIFNPRSLAIAFLEFNMVYTSEDKDKEILHFRNIHEVAFLKRAFVWDEENSVVIAPLEIETIRQMLYFHEKGKNYRTVIESTFESFLHELALHPEDKWIEYYSKIAPIMLDEFSYETKVTDFNLRRKNTLKLEEVY